MSRPIVTCLVVLTGRYVPDICLRRFGHISGTPVFQAHVRTDSFSERTPDVDRSLENLERQDADGDEPTAHSHRGRAYDNNFGMTATRKIAYLSRELALVATLR